MLPPMRFFSVTEYCYFCLSRKNLTNNAILADSASVGTVNGLNFDLLSVI